MNSLGERIKYCRTVVLNEKQEAFARTLGFDSKVVVSNWENNNRIPEVSTLITIAQLTSCTLDWLLLGIGAPPLPKVVDPKFKESEYGKAFRKAAKEILKNNPGDEQKVSRVYDKLKTIINIPSVTEEKFTYPGLNNDEINIIRKMKEIPEAVPIISKILDNLIDVQEGIRQLTNLSPTQDKDKRRQDKSGDLG
ncbi:MAG: helix-turn-helix domain-containing protein [Ignavibacteria bacterium]|jgi:transcriptional regulator with XRE-family HTH domain|nr:helix-turn-helix domain-containing protein [Ignavibacteria bacterium]MCU7503832.1 helix-turn-helix domain-containing protein [Ignavibacteria bacterium]MCU7517154.1 helix-turn-helix domain-containing protein [Ignavibacteria bacterium]